jgi:enoyl-CoA hydratase/carnithine racemase
MVDMMLTGRVLDADEGARAGLAQYRVADGAGLTKALELAAAIGRNSAIANYAVIQALPRIAQAPAETGLLLESLMAAVTQVSSEAQDRMAAFLAGRAPKVSSAPEDR